MGSPLSYDFADPVALTVNIKDANGALANATAVTLTVTLPDGTLSSPAVTNPTAGVYQATYIPIMVGLHAAQWVATGVNASGFSDTFDVRSGTPPYLVSLIDAKQFLNITSSINDEELRGFIEAATQVVENVVGPVIPRTIVEVHSRPGPVLQLQQPPAIRLISLSSILTMTPFLGGSQVYDVTLLDLDPGTGIVRRLDGYPLGRRFTGLPPSPLRIVYTAGRLAVPASITIAAKVIIDCMWETQRGHLEGTRPRPGGGGSSSQKGKGVKDTIPKLALEMLQPYRQPLPIM